MQLTVRDRNRLALTADLLGAWALGARNLLCLTGDPLSVGDHPDARAADDLNVTELIRLGTALRTRGHLLPGHEIDEPPRYFVGVADSPLAPNYDPARLEAKLDAGGAFVVTQITYDLEALLAWVDVVRTRGIPQRAAVLVGVAPIRSAKQAHFLNDHLPGVSVPQPLLAALRLLHPPVDLVRGRRPDLPAARPDRPQLLELAVEHAQDVRAAARLPSVLVEHNKRRQSWQSQ